jgi:hypothetical protein
MKTKPLKVGSGPLGLAHTHYIQEPNKRYAIASGRVEGLLSKLLQLVILSGYEATLVLQPPPDDALPSVLYSSHGRLAASLAAGQRLVGEARPLSGQALRISKLLERYRNTTVNITNEDLRKSQPRIGTTVAAPPTIIMLPDMSWRDPCFSHSVYTFKI